MTYALLLSTPDHATPLSASSGSDASSDRTILTPPESSDSESEIPSPRTKLLSKPTSDGAHSLSPGETDTMDKTSSQSESFTTTPVTTPPTSNSTLLRAPYPSQPPSYPLSTRMGFWDGIHYTNWTLLWGITAVAQVLLAPVLFLSLLRWSAERTTEEWGADFARFRSEAPIWYLKNPFLNSSTPVLATPILKDILETPSFIVYVPCTVFFTCALVLWKTPHDLKVVAFAFQIVSFWAVVGLSCFAYMMALSPENIVHSSWGRLIPSFFPYFLLLPIMYANQDLDLWKDSYIWSYGDWYYDKVRSLFSYIVILPAWGKLALSVVALLIYDPQTLRIERDPTKDNRFFYQLKPEQEPSPLPKNYSPEPGWKDVCPDLFKSVAVFVGVYFWDHWINPYTFLQTVFELSIPGNTTIECLVLLALILIIAKACRMSHRFRWSLSFKDSMLRVSFYGLFYGVLYIFWLLVLFPNGPYTTYLNNSTILVCLHISSYAVWEKVRRKTRRVVRYDPEAGRCKFVYLKDLLETERYGTGGPNGTVDRYMREQEFVAMPEDFDISPKGDTEMA